MEEKIMLHAVDPIFFYAIIGSALVVFLSITLFIFFISYHKRKFQHIREKQELQANFQQALLQTQLEIQEQTFRYISQEIHDNIGQMLSLVKLDLNTTDITQTRLADQKIQRSKELVSKAIGDLRDLSKSLNPEIIMQIGLGEAVQRELLRVAKTGQYNANLTQHGDTYRLTAQSELIIFRILQEILNNIINHARARTIDVMLEYHRDRFILTVSDDGKGFDTRSLESDTSWIGLGIHSMRNRAKLIGAVFNLTSIPERGTVITVELPHE
jgi:two-component system, NarL family, sensor kinase